MRATEDPRSAELEDRLLAFVDTRFAPPLEMRGIEVTAAARNLFVRTVLAQAQAGIVAAENLMAAVEIMDLAGLEDFYLLKFGPRPLSYNRMLRLLGDMHDKWILFRHTAVAVPGGAGNTE